MTALDEAIAEESGDVGGRGPTQADILIDLAQTAELFHAPDGTGFADLDINGHRETWPIRSKGFRRWLARRFFEETRRRAEFGGAAIGAERDRGQGAFRCAGTHGPYPRRRAGRPALPRPLATQTWRAVEIDATGWRVIDNPPVRFRRAAGMKPMPMPVAGGSIEILRSFLNVKSDADFVLVVAWALACLAQSRSLSGDRAVGRAGIGQVHLLRRSCGRCSIPTPRPCGPCRARIAICSSPPATAMCWPSTTCRACPPGFRTRFAGSRPAAASLCASSTPTRTRCCSTPPGR